MPPSVVALTETFLILFSGHPRQASMIRRLTSDPEMASVFDFLESNFDEYHQQVYMSAAFEACGDGEAARQLLTEAKLVQREIVASLYRAKLAFRRLERLLEEPTSEQIDVPDNLLQVSDMVRHCDARSWVAAEQWRTGVLAKAGARVVDLVSAVQGGDAVEPLRPSTSVKRSIKRIQKATLRVAARRSHIDPQLRKKLRPPQLDRVERKLSRLPNMEIILALIISSRHPYGQDPKNYSMVELIENLERTAELWKPAFHGQFKAALARTSHVRNEFIRALWSGLKTPSVLAQSTKLPSFTMSAALLNAIATTANVALDDPDVHVTSADVRNALKGSPSYRSSTGPVEPAPGGEDPQS